MGAWGHTELSSEALFSSGCCCHWTSYLGVPRLGIPATIRPQHIGREPEEKGHVVPPCLFHTAMVRSGQHTASWWPLRRSSGDQAHVAALPQYRVALALGMSHSPLNGGTGAQGTLPWLSPSCSNLAPYTVPPTGQGPPSWGHKSLPSSPPSSSVQHKKQMVPKVSPSLASMSCKCYASKLFPLQGPAKWPPPGDTSLTPPCSPLLIPQRWGHIRTALYSLFLCLFPKSGP